MCNSMFWDKRYASAFYIASSLNSQLMSAYAKEQNIIKERICREFTENLTEAWEAFFQGFV